MRKVIFLAIITTCIGTVLISKAIDKAKDQKRKDEQDADNALQYVKTMLAELNEQGY